MDSCLFKDVCSELKDNCEKSCVRYTEFKYLLDSSGIPSAKQKPIKLEPCPEDYAVFNELGNLKLNIVDFVEQGGNIYIGSSICGNGKTSWAIKLMLKYFNEIWAGNGLRPRGLFISVPTFLAQLKDFENKDSNITNLKNLIPQVDLVIWDDIGSSLLSNYDLNNLTMFIDNRVLGEKANIYTGNLLGKSLEKVVGERLYSRVWNMSDKFIIKGMDNRRGILDGSVTSTK